MSQQKPTSDERINNPDSATENVDVGAMHAQIMREQNEPRDGYEPIPIWLVAVFGVLLFWGGWYLSTYSGGWRSDVLNEDPSVWMVQSSGGPAKPLDPLVLGENLFIGNCTACHGVTGKGQPGVFPPLAASEWVTGNPARLKRIVLHGLQGSIVVEGETYSGAMPAFATVFNDEKMAAVLTYIRHAWGNNASPISAAEVAATREATKSQVAPYTAAKLAEVQEDDLVPGAAPKPVAPADNKQAPGATSSPTTTSTDATTAPKP